MRFKTLDIEGFLSIGKAEIALDNQGLVLIEGRNEDDPSAKSNGSGKSSLMDALCWCLYGKTARGLSGEEVINNHCKTCKVALSFEEGSTRYRVTRSRKSKSVNLDVEYERVAGGEVIANNFTKGTVADTQLEVERIIGCPYNVFVAAVYAGQEAMPDLPNMTDKQLKELIESVIGVERLTKAYELAKEEWNEANLAHAKAQTSLGALEGVVTGLQGQLEAAEAGDKEAKARFEQRKMDIRGQLAEKAKELDKAEEEAKALTSEAEETERQIEALTTSINQIEESQAKVKAAMDEASRASWAYSKAINDFDHVRAEAKKLNDQLTNVNSRLNTRCSECGKIYTADDLAPARERAKAKVKEAVERAMKMKEATKPLRDEAERAQAAYEAAKAAVPSNAAFVQKSKLTEKLNQIREKQKLPEKIKYQISQLKDELKMVEGAESSMKSSASIIETQIAETNEKIEKTKLVYNAAKEKLAVLEVCKSIYGPTGVRQHVLDTITPVLNDRTTRYLDVLSDGKLRAVWTTLTHTKKGEVKEKFNIAVTNTVGGGSFESLSGGEKRKVRVACCLALQELVASRATKPIELFIADEVDHALDEAGVERLIGVLQEKANCCKSLFVISHNPLRNWIENVITVTKHDGISTVE